MVIQALIGLKGWLRIGRFPSVARDVGDVGACLLLALWSNERSLSYSSFGSQVGQNMASSSQSRTYATEACTSD